MVDFIWLPGYEKQQFWNRKLLFILMLPKECGAVQLLSTQKPINSPDWWKGKFQFSSVQSLSHVRLFWTPWIAAGQDSLSITNSRNSPNLMFIESVIPSSHLILCRPLLLLPSVPRSIRLFYNELTLCLRWPKCWSFSFSINPSNEHPGSPLEWTGWISLQSKELSRVFSKTTVQKHQFFGAQLSSQSNSHIHTWPLEKHSLD